MRNKYGLDAGIYIPTLANNIVKGQKTYPINLSGMAIGNGYVNVDMSTRTGREYLYNHGIIEEEAWQQYEKKCCKNGLGTSF